MTYDGLLAELTSYVGFGPEDAAILVDAGPSLAPAFDDIVDSFYAAIEAQPRARSVFRDGDQIERQKVMLGRWLRELFTGEYGQGYYESRARIGVVHVRIGLDPAYMVAAMNLIRVGLHDAVVAHCAHVDWPTTRRTNLHAAIDRICDIDLAIMLETYRDDFAVRIRTAEKLAALGEIAGTIGHEIRNPLAVMETSIHLLRSRVGNDEKSIRHLDKLTAQVELCASIVRNLLDLARERAPIRTVIAVEDVIREALAAIPGAEGIHVIVGDPPPGLCSVDRVELRQLIVNFVSNALHAARSGPAGVWVRIDRIENDLHIIVDDDGPGIPEEIRTRLFEPLFTTRSSGVGFGLAFCRRIAERHGGHVRASNRVEGGARFVAVLPCGVAGIS